MAFKEITKGSAGRSDPHRNYVAVYVNKGQITFKVSADVLEIFGAPKRLRVLLGDGINAGTALLKPTTPDNSKAYAVSRKSNELTGSISVKTTRPGFEALRAIADMRTTECEFDVSEDGILIQLPSFQMLPMAAE